MAILPNAAMLATEQTVAPRYPVRVPKDILSAVPNAIGSLGTALMNAGLEMEKQQNHGKDYELAKRWNDFKAARDQEYEDLKNGLPQDAPPEGFSDKVNSTFDAGAREFFKTVPPEKKAEYDYKLGVMHGKQVRDAASDEQNLRDKYYFNDAGRRLESYNFKLAQDPSRHGTITQQAKEEIDALPLTPEKKEKLYKALSGLDKTAILHDLRLGKDPDEIARDLVTPVPAPNPDDPRMVKTEIYRTSPEDLAKSGFPPSAKPASGTGGETTVTKAAGGTVSAAGGGIDISPVLETGAKNPLKGVGNISSDTNGSQSYGNYGLNSQPGASAWDFRRDYGEKFGLTAEPGTPEFEIQWRAAAKDKPAELLAAERDWWNKNVFSGVGPKLNSIGVPETMSSDPRVQAYFADRMIQHGPASIDKHASRIGAAFMEAAADDPAGDPVKFLEAMSEADKDKVSGDFRSYLRGRPGNVGGLENRIANRLKLALQAGGSGEADQGAETLNAGMKSPGGKMLDQLRPAGGQDTSKAQRGGDVAQTETAPALLPKYPNLSVKDRDEILQKVREAGRQKRISELDNSIEAIKQNGEAPVSEDGRTALDRAKASQALTPKQIESYTQKWASAQIEHKMIAGLEGMSPDEIGQHLEQFTPDPKSPDYKSMVDAQKRAETKVKSIMAMRDRDPALAVNDLPEVRQGYQEMERQREPVTTISGIQVEQPVISSQDAWRHVISARLAAQTRVGIPVHAQSPITVKEASDLLALGRNPDATLATMASNEALDKLQEAASRAQLKFGPEYGSKAFSAAARFLLRGQQNRQEAAGLIATIASGQALTGRDIAAYEQEKTMLPMRQFGQMLEEQQGVVESPFAMPSPPLPLPTPEQIKIIQAHPDKWREVDAIFGAGTTARALKTDLSVKPKAEKKSGWSISNLWGGE